MFLSFFFFNDTATTEIYTLSLHDALPIYTIRDRCRYAPSLSSRAHHLCLRHGWRSVEWRSYGGRSRSEEPTSELPSRPPIGCRRLLGNKPSPKQLAPPAGFCCTDLGASSA